MGFFYKHINIDYIDIFGMQLGYKIKVYRDTNRLCPFLNLFFTGHNSPTDNIFGRKQYALGKIVL